MRRKNLITLTIGILLLFTIKSSAQQSSGSMRGTITDYSGEVVPNAQVTVKSENFAQTTTSSESGEYSFAQLPPGIYQISVKAINGLSYKRSALTIEVNLTTKLNIPLEYGSDCENEAGKIIELTDEDKAEIVNQIIENALVKKEIPDYQLLTDQKSAIILSSANIKPEWIKTPENVDLKVLSDNEIKQKADKNGDFLYLSFREFKIKGECVVVTFANDWSVGKKSKSIFLSGGGNVYIFRKESGKFTGRIVSSWIS